MWYKHCYNPESLENLYSDTSGLDDVELFEVIVDYHRGRLTLRFELPRFPDKVPKRWPATSNAVQATVSFGGLRDLRLEGNGLDNYGKLSIKPAGDDLELRFEGEHANLSARCHAAIIDRFSDYLRSDEEIL